MNTKNYFKRLYLAYFTNANIWIVQYDGGFYCNELCSKIEAKFITSKCPGSRMYIFDPLNTTYKFCKRTPVVFLLAILWTLVLFSIVYGIDYLIGYAIYENNNEAKEFGLSVLEKWLVIWGVWHYLKRHHNFIKEY